MSELSTLLASIAGILLSLAFAYVPGLSDWYANQTAQIKSLVMLLALVGAAFGSYAAACWQLFDIPGLTCDDGGARVLVSAFIMALAANQSTYLATRKLRNP